MLDRIRSTPTVILKYCEIQARPYGCTTIFPDGTETGNWPHSDQRYFQVAAACGHENDLIRYCREHDLCHALLAERMFDKPSPILWRSAHGQSSFELGDFEERLVYYFQRFMHEKCRAPDVDWLCWRDEAKRHLRQLQC